MFPAPDDVEGPSTDIGVGVSCEGIAAGDDDDERWTDDDVGWFGRCSFNLGGIWFFSELGGVRSGLLVGGGGGWCINDGGGCGVATADSGSNLASGTDRLS